jgi:hypothetical protein
MKKRLLILITPLVLVSHSFADQIDDIVQDAIKHGAHGKTYAQMRDLVELGAHYDARRGVWTSFNNKATLSWVHSCRSGSRSSAILNIVVSSGIGDWRQPS